MASFAQTFPNSPARLSWLWELLKQELAPYPGRVALVTRMVLASTVVMILTMTFQLPYGVYGAIFAVNLSRESLEATTKAVRMLIIGFLLAGVYVILGLLLALGEPILRFLWVAAGFGIAFWAMSALNSYAASARFAYLIAITTPLWDQDAPASFKVENTLWAVGVLSLSSVITWMLEIVFWAFNKSDSLIAPLVERLTCVEDLLTNYMSGDPVKESIRATLARLATTGTSRMRQMLHRTGFDPQHTAEMAAVVALTGRLVDLAANLAEFTSRVPETDRERIGRVAQSIRAIRDHLAKGSIPQPAPESVEETESAPGLPLLGEIEHTVSLIPEAFTASRSPSALAPSNTGPVTSFSARALLDSEHLKFGLRGCLAATSCYVVYNALFWPEISTSVTTCVVTALSTVGASHQKQLLRFAGALTGGVIMGMGAQIFILPSIDSIAGFTALFIVVTVIASWIASSSARLAYFGTQIAIAFDLIHLTEFRFQTSLALARDRVIGILLGLFMMWLFFDQLWSKPSGVAMKRTFVETLRLLAQLAREPVSKDLPVAIERSYALRDTINARFDGVRSLADAVILEFGPSRQRDLEFRRRVYRWQPQLRTLFLMRIASLKYRLQLPGFELPESVQLQQQAYDEHSARMLEELADRIDHNSPSSEDAVERSHGLLSRTIEEAERQKSTHLPQSHAESFIALLGRIDDLTTSLATEIGSTSW